jgi:hypothetical protein
MGKELAVPRVNLCFEYVETLEGIVLNYICFSEKTVKYSLYSRDDRPGNIANEIKLKNIKVIREKGLKEYFRFDIKDKVSIWEEVKDMFKAVKPHDEYLTMGVYFNGVDVDIFIQYVKTMGIVLIDNTIGK